MSPEILKKINEKMKKINDNLDNIKDVKEKESNIQDLSEELLPYINEISSMLKDYKKDFTELNKNQDKAIEDENLEKIGKNMQKKEDKEKQVKTIGETVVESVKALPPQSFIVYAVKEFINLFKEIGDDIKNFDKKTSSFINDKFGKKMNVINDSLKKQVDMEKIKDFGLMGLNGSALKLISDMEKEIQKIEKSGIIKPEVLNKIKNNELLDNNDLKIFKFVPVLGLLDTIKNFQDFKMSIVENLSEFAQKQEKQTGMPASEIIANQLKNFSKEAVNNISSLVSSVSQTVSNPYAQAVEKGIETVIRLKPKVKEQERKVSDIKR